MKVQVWFVISMCVLSIDQLFNGARGFDVVASVLVIGIRRLLQLFG